MFIEKIIIVMAVISLNTLLSFKYIKDKYVINLIIMFLSIFSFGIYICYAYLDVNMSLLKQNVLFIFMFAIPSYIYISGINENRLKYMNINKDINNGNYQKAIQKLEKIILKHGRKSSSCYLLGMAYKLNGDYLEARDYFTIATELDNLDYRSYYELAGVLELIGEKDKIIVMYNNSLKIKPDFYDAIESLGIYYTASKMYNEAIQIYTKGLEYHDSSYELHYNIAMIQMEVGLIDEALDNFLKAIDINPKLYSASFNAGYIYNRKEDKNNAVKYFEKARSSTFSGGRAYYELAKIYSGLDEIERAKTCLEYAILINPDYLKDSKSEIVFTNILEYIYEYEEDLNVLETNKRRHKDYMHDENDKDRKINLIEKKIRKDIKENNSKLYIK